MDADTGHALERALTLALCDVIESVTRIAVAYSGGADSTALLHVASTLQRRGLVEVFAFHVHHGLAAAADEWLAHCRQQAASFGVAFDTEHIVVARSGASIEAEARTLRYAALARLCRRHGCTVLMTAHHADDQAESVLLNLARGAGIGGLAATARSRRLDDLLLVRPLIDQPGEALRDYITDHALAHVEDPSNTDRRYTRNAIRHEVMPVLRRIVPTIAARLARTAAHASTMQQLLDEIATEDLRDASSRDDDLDIERLAALSDARAANALRAWIARRGMRAPSAAALKEMLGQLLHASPDAQIALLHERQTLRLYRGRVSIDAGGTPRASFVPLVWRGEGRLDVPSWHGSLVFSRTSGRGFDALALHEGPLAIRARRGGERLRTRIDGPSRTLKNLYQEAGIATWQRTRLPLVYLGERLIHAAGLGPNAGNTIDGSAQSEAVRLEWQAHDDRIA